jgi:plasmid stability protein
VANLTIAIEDDVLKKARLHALEQGTSVNAVVREFLREYTGKASRQAEAAKRLIELAHESGAEVGHITWTRDEVHDRQASRQ